MEYPSPACKAARRACRKGRAGILLFAVCWLGTKRRDRWHEICASGLNVGAGLTVTFKTGAPPDMFELVAPSIIIGAARTYDVVGATQVSPTEMYFDTNAPGAATQRIHVKDGKATTARSRTTLPLPPLITSSLSVS